MSKKVLLFLNILVCLIALPTKTYSESLVYKGTIGKYPIILKLSIDSEGRIDDLNYYYKSQNISFHFDVLEDSNDIIAKNYSDYYKKNIDEEFQLRFSKDGLKGIWKKNNKTLPVRLKIAHSNDYSTSYDDLPFIRSCKSTDLFAYLKFIDIIPVAIDTLKSTSQSDYFVTVLKVNKSDITSFQICSNDTKKYKKINDKLLNDYYEELNRFWDYEEPCNYSSSKDIFLADNNFFSYSINWFVNCESPSPYGDLTIYNLDLKSGKDILLKDVINFGIEIIDTSNKTITGERILKLLIDSKSFAEVDSNYVESWNDYFNPNSWNYSIFNLSDKGVYFYMRLSDPVDNTLVGDKFLIPYSRLYPFLSPQIIEKINFLKEQ
jgi:hypothetical protein